MHGPLALRPGKRRLSDDYCINYKQAAGQNVHQLLSKCVSSNLGLLDPFFSKIIDKRLANGRPISALPQQGLMLTEWYVGEFKTMVMQPLVV